MTGRKANANPTKAFFVRMLTRDISLDDCILDLVDNSIDGAWQDSGQNPSSLDADSSLAGYRVSIEFGADGFHLEDNCGGISLDDAVEYAFTFGRREEQARTDYSVGVYGIGMKRAVFKLGNTITIASTFRDDSGDLAAFQVPIRVDEWLHEDKGSWDFDIDDAPVANEAGVTIRVDDLTEETALKFSDPTYPRKLRRLLARDYMIPLMRGLEITVNGESVQGWKLELRENENFAPMKDSYADGEVSVEIIAGMASPPPDDREADDQAKPDVSGWYILCNGRVVLAADTSAITGWGITLPRWHKQYTGFAGVVLFSAENPALLPMTTTKRNVDVSSVVYQRALARMHHPARAWINYTNARKQDLEALKALEENVTPVDVFAVRQRTEVKLPEITRASSRERMANVNYSVPLSRLRALARGLGDAQLTYRDVGLSSFDYAYEDLAEEE